LGAANFTGVAELGVNQSLSYAEYYHNHGDEIFVSFVLVADLKIGAVIFFTSDYS
jgi:hypothetical protein